MFIRFPHSAPTKNQLALGSGLGIDVHGKDRGELSKLIDDAQLRVIKECLKRENVRPGSVILYDDYSGSDPHLYVVTRLNLDHTWVRAVANGRRRDISTMSWTKLRLTFTCVHNPPEGWIHSLAVLPNKTMIREEGLRGRTDQLIKFIAERLHDDERQTHPEYGEYWQQSAVTRFKELFEAS